MSVNLKALSNFDLFEAGEIYTSVSMQMCQDSEECDPSYAVAAIPFLQEAINLSPEHAEYYYYLNRAIIYGGKVEEFGVDYTMSLLDKAISLSPSIERYYEARASAYEAMQKPELAAVDKEKVKRISPIVRLETVQVFHSC